MRKIVVTCALVALAAGFGSAAVAQDTARAEDRAKIEALMWRYVRALDTLDADAYAAVYTENGVFSAGGQPTKGREALKQMVAGLRAGQTESPAPMYHMIVNSNVEFVAEDRALFHSYWMTVFGPAAQGEAPRVAAVGRGIDELVRVNGEWLIESRNVAPQD